MWSLLDIITAAFIGAILILMIMGVIFYIQSSSHEVNYASITQMNLKEIVEVIDHDIVKIGYRVSTQKILFADSTRLIFRSDIDNNGKIDTLGYFLGNASELTSTPNPYDRILYRKENDRPLNVSKLGIVVDFKFTYYDSTNSKINYASLTSQIQRDRIRAIEYYVRVESPEIIENYYPGAEMKKIIRPKNLNI